MTRALCVVDTCDRTVHGRGLCSMHWKRWRKYGDPQGGVPHYTSSEESFAARTEWQGDCLVWVGGKTADGYGRITAGGKTFAHRYAWERENGPIPEGMQVDHICWNRACVNAQHLRLATRYENARNLSGPRADNTSGYRGVCWVESRSSWAAVVKVNGRQKWRYGFKTAEEAAVVAQDMRDEHYGEFAGAKTIGATAVRNYRDQMEA